MLRKAFIGAALAFLCLLPVSSDDVRIITLEEAIRSAAEHNLDIEYAKTELSSTLRIQDNVMSTFMPEISLRASVSPAVNFPTSSGTAISYDGLTVSAGADVSFPFTGGMLNDGRDRSIAREEASLGFRSAYLSVEEDVVDAYWDLAGAAAERDSAEAAFNLADEQYKSAQAGYESGRISELSLRQTEYSLSTAALTLSEAEDSLLIAQEELKALTGLEGDFSAMPLPEPVFLSLPSEDDLFAKYSEGTIDIQAARNSLEKAISAKETSVLNTYVPSLTASIGYSYSGKANGSWDYSHSTNRLSGSISLRVPISQMLPGGSGDSAIKLDEDTIRLETIALSQANKTLLQDIRLSVIEISHQQKTINDALRSEELARRTYQLSQEGYDAGIVSALDLANARTELLRSQMTTISCKVDHLKECYALSYLLNTDLSALQAAYSI